MPAPRTQRVKGVCSAHHLLEEDNEPNRPYISFKTTGVQSKTEPATAARQKNGTWSFGLLTAARPWYYAERKKPALLLGGEDELDLSYMYGGAGGKGEPL